MLNKNGFPVLAGCGMIFLQSIKGKSLQRARLIAMRKKNIVACRALGLLYSYNCIVIGRPHREIVFPIRVPDWIWHDINGVSLSMAYLITGIIGKVPGQDRF
jgi:hypothetical protein